MITPFGRRPTVDGIKAGRSMRRVLLVLLTDATNLSGLTFTRAAAIGIGSVYSCLDRLEAAGWVTSDWEDAPYPRRRFYRLTPAGWVNAHTLLGLKRAEARRG